MFEIAAGSRRIGIGEPNPCFLIAEAGVNHNGEVGLAKKLVDAAADAGADAVKFQTWRTEKLVAPGAPAAAYQKRAAGDAEIGQFTLLRKLELGEEAFSDIAAHAAERGILFLSTPDEEESADFLDTLAVPLFKVGSGEVTNLRFLHHVGSKGKPVILSTGMSSLGEIERAVETLTAAGAPHLVLLHCVSSYPADPAESNLRAMSTLRAAFGHPIGFSDHTLGRDVAVAAVALGACVLEKHLTLDVEMDGPDHRASLGPEEFSELVRSVRSVEQALGDGRKRPTPSEEAMKLLVRRRVLAGRDLPSGTRLAETDLVLRRAGSGEPAEALPILLGGTLTRDVAAGEPLTRADIR